MSQAKSTGPLLQRHSLNMISLHANLWHRFLDQKLSFTVVTVHFCHACSPVIGNLAEHRPSVHSVSASCIPGKFLDNSEVVVLAVRILYNQEIWRHKLRGAIHSTKIQTGPTGKRGPPQKVDQFFRNFSGWTEPIHWVSDRNFRKLWLNGSRPGSAKKTLYLHVCALLIYFTKT